MRSLLKGRQLLLVSVAGAAAFVVAGFAFAAIPGTGGVVHGCYGNSNGQLRVIDSGSCKNNETALDWNATASGTTLFAVVNPNGSLARGSGGATSSQIDVGEYEVIFNRDVSGCAYTATEGSDAAGTPPAGYAVVASRAGNSNGVFVRTFNSAGVDTDRGFHLIVAC